MRALLNYKSFADLSNDVLHALHKIPPEIDLVVGVPRSGLMVASVLALNLNVRFCELGAFLRNDPLRTGSTRNAGGGDIVCAQQARNVLVVDDSIHTGKALDAVREQIGSCGYSGKVTYMAFYATPGSTHMTDVYAQVVPMPRLFQWNTCHRKDLATFCFAIDGVLCEPLRCKEEDAEYLDAIAYARRQIVPTYKVGYLVTSRSERYRRQTELWLSQNGIQYQQLYMPALPAVSREEKAAFKAKIYASLSDAVLFIESDQLQAARIADLSGKPVLDFGNQVMLSPRIGIQLLRQKTSEFAADSVGLPARIGAKLKKLLSGRRRSAT
ncbi:MAG TPA: phosphoribosyltransferase family protein [Oxalicibacterium sp.]|nr:phosphoribosyltransferase family protein [Oxalicibacterium sp.]